jgi:hypothetical protein
MERIDLAGQDSPSRWDEGTKSIVVSRRRGG